MSLIANLDWTLYLEQLEKVYLLVIWAGHQSPTVTYITGKGQDQNHFNTDWPQASRQNLSRQGWTLKGYKDSLTKKFKIQVPNKPGIPLDPFLGVLHLSLLSHIFCVCPKKAGLRKSRESPVGTTCAKTEAQHEATSCSSFILLRNVQLGACAGLLPSVAVKANSKVILCRGGMTKISNAVGSS